MSHQVDPLPRTPGEWLERLSLAADQARRARRDWIETIDHAHNAAMLAVNRALGYRRVAGNLVVQRP